MEEFKPKHSLEDLQQRDAIRLEAEKDILRKKINPLVDQIWAIRKQITDRRQNVSMLDSLNTKEARRQKWTLENEITDLEKQEEIVGFKARDLILKYNVTFPGPNEYDDLLSELPQPHDTV